MTARDREAGVGVGRDRGGVSDGAACARALCAGTDGSLGAARATAPPGAQGSKGGGESSGNKVAEGAGVPRVSRSGSEGNVVAGGGRGRGGKAGMMSKVKGRISGFLSELKEEVLRD